MVSPSLSCRVMFICGIFRCAGSERSLPLPPARDSLGICVVSVAVGKRFIDVEQLTGVTKQHYVAKWNYTYMPYKFDDEEEFLAWCHTTKLFKISGASSLKYDHPVMKYFTLAHALNEGGCSKALMIDADALIVNSDVRIDFNWPNAAKSSGETHMLFTLDTFVQGATVNLTCQGDDPKCHGTFSSHIVPRESRWCMTGDPCRNFTKFWSCLNTGTFIVDNSSVTLAFLTRVIQGTFVGSRALNCSTASFNPWHIDQCGMRDGRGDQCLSGCALLNSNRELGRSIHEMPDGISCVDSSSRPRMQQTWKAVTDLDNDGSFISGRQPLNDTFVVNIFGYKKRPVLFALMKVHPQLRQMFNDSTIQHMFDSCTPGVSTRLGSTGSVFVMVSRYPIFWSVIAFPTLLALILALSWATIMVWRRFSIATVDPRIVQSMNRSIATLDDMEALQHRHHSSVAQLLP